MLHMVVNTHNAESCAYRGEAEDQALTQPLKQFGAGNPDLELTLVGTWVNRASHEIFMLVDAPNGHVIEQALIETGVLGRTHSRILPVVDTQKLIEEEERRQQEANA
jgi:hypothetical protein